MPGTYENIYYGDEWKSKLQSAYDRAKKALSFEENEKGLDAVEEWKKIFGEEFPTLDAGKNIVMSLLNYIDNYPSAKEMFIEDFGVKMNPVYKLKINADVQQKNYRKYKLLGYPYPLSKDLIIEFYIEKNLTPGTYSIKWKVKNQGKEALIAEDLRGEITNDGGRKKKFEHTKYWGKHFVECYIIQNNICVAYDRIFVPIGEN
jgi:hypothetical protein